jgi:hypothetical protein
MNAQRRVTTPAHRMAEAVTSSSRMDSLQMQVSFFREPQSPPGTGFVPCLTQKNLPAFPLSALVRSGAPGTGWFLF